MKNIQVIDGAENCVYDIFQATDEEFLLIFKSNTNIAFSEEVWRKNSQEELKKAFTALWSRPVIKSEANGIHGILFYGLEEKIKYYPTLRDQEAINPDGTALRSWQP